MGVGVLAYRCRRESESTQVADSGSLALDDALAGLCFRVCACRLCAKTMKKPVTVEWLLNGGGLGVLSYGLLFGVGGFLLSHNLPAVSYTHLRAHET